MVKRLEIIFLGIFASFIVLNTAGFTSYEDESDKPRRFDSYLYGDINRGLSDGKI